MTITRDPIRSFLLLAAAVATGVGLGSKAVGAPLSALPSDGPSVRSTDSPRQMAKNEKKAKEQKKAKKQKAENAKGENGKGDDQREEAWEKGKGEGHAWGKGHGQGKPDKD